jgi:hypothetical protein
VCHPFFLLKLRRPDNTQSPGTFQFWARKKFFDRSELKTVTGFILRLEVVESFTYGADMSQLPAKKKKGSALLLGVALDSDGHKRLTTGPNFALVGGTAESHEVMTEKAVKINEKLSARGKSLENVSREEFDDIALSVGLKKHEPEKN